MASSTTSNSSTDSTGSITTAPTITTTPNNANQTGFTLSEVERLNYEIFRYSSYSPNYLPENILIDCPSDQTSRWSAYTNNPPQYLTLKLKRPAIVKKIKFGKFERSHVCNIKKFRIYGGLEDDQMVMLLEGGLKNDNVPEVFNLRCLTEDGSENLPILYLKIVPLLSWGPSFNFSIWYIELHGQDDPMYTSARMRNYNMLREVEIIKLCLKHFRQQGYTTAFDALQQQTNIRLEHGLISQLHECLVVEGNFERAEEFLVECAEEGLMDAYLNRQDYKHRWQLRVDANEQPGYRGGHQLVVDSRRRLLYLYGGWDGYQDLSDLWVFDIKKGIWSLLFEKSEIHNGPTPRSCHKMIFDPVSENIFVLGRYLESSIRTSEYIKSDFFLYDTRSRTWLQICDDTSQIGGPQLVYDHQMCIDAQKRTIYVFGGKVLTPRCGNAISSSEPEYSGLFSYHIATNTWTQILVDCHHPSASQPDVMSIKSRFTHCMVFHNRHRKLYIYGGQRGKEDIDDFLAYDVDDQSITLLNKDNQNNNNAGAETKFEPSPGYTLRATIDCERDEIYVFSSLSKTKNRTEGPYVYASNSFWVYSLQTHKWSRIYYWRHNLQDTSNKVNNDTIIDPCPRFAHQFVYDDVGKVHYLFGGNPGIHSMQQMRLDDFWILTLEKPRREDILKHCRYMVRKLHYEEMARKDPINAMIYLRNHISAVINFSDAEQLSSFHKLASLLFKTDETALPIEAPSPAFGGSNMSDDDVMIVQTRYGTGEGAVERLNTNSNAPEDFSMESCESTSGTSGISEPASTSSFMHNYARCRNGSGSVGVNAKRPRHDHNFELKNRRAFLFNKLVQLMPSSMVQPERNLSDFVVI